VTNGGGLDLGRPRDVGALLRDSLRALRARPWTFLAVSVAFVVPIDLVVLGFGLEQLSGPYDRSPDWPQTAIPAAVDYLVLTPLVTAGVIHVLVEMAGGRRPGAWEAIQRALDVFTPLFVAIVLVALGVLVGLLAFLIPGIYLFFRWFFVPQAVVLEGRRDAAALHASADLVGGAWWRTFGALVLANLVALLPSLVVGLPFQALAESANREVLALVGGMLSDAISTPYVAAVATLLYFELKRRRPAL
jgi:hypothetical protein